MRDKTTLETLYKKEVAEFKELQKKHFETLESITEEYVKHAQYSIGDKVKAPTGWENSGELKDGIIRAVLPKSRYSSELHLCYIIGRVKKNGEIHASQNIKYRDVEEEAIICICG